ncbi:MAG: tryptophan 2,3-dioxygenase family protein, partial [Ilumatobacteraceae bacterium]
PRQFASFRPELGSASGFQSNQWRQIEATLGRRDFVVPSGDPLLDAAVGRRSMFDSLLRYLASAGWEVPNEVLERDPARPWEADPTIQVMLLEVYRNDADPSAEVCEALVDIDEGVQEWRYRHIKMVERIIGAKVGTGGSAGAEYLRSTLFRPAFPDLWDIRARV